MDWPEGHGYIPNVGLANFPELKKLPKQRKSRLAEELWLSCIEDSSPVSAARRALLDQRWKAYRSGKAKRLTLEELENRLARPP
jgi:putative addiction module component (TIGR02574 family)